jgi:hypothetical protein
LTVPPAAAISRLFRPRPENYMLTWIKSWFGQEKQRPSARPTVLARRATKLQRSLVATVGQQTQQVVLLSRTEVVLAVRQGQPADSRLEICLHNPKTGARYEGTVRLARVQRGFDGNWQLKCVFDRPLERDLLAALLA